MRPLLLSPLLCLGAATGCDNDQPRAGDESTGAAAACESRSDCEQGMVCLDRECVDPSAKGLYTDPSNAVTPDKVKREVEAIGAERGARADEALDL